MLHMRASKGHDDYLPIADTVELFYVTEDKNDHLQLVQNYEYFDSTEMDWGNGYRTMLLRDR